MTVELLAQALHLEYLAGRKGAQRPVRGGYCGDLLSWVMGRAGADDAWITIMGNLNAVGVAALADVACIVLAENAALDDDAKTRADIEGIPVLRGAATQFDLCCLIQKQLNASRKG